MIILRHYLCSPFQVIDPSWSTSSLPMSSSTASSGKIQVLSDIEHVLKRSGMYIGGHRSISEEMYVCSSIDADGDHSIEKRTINYVPGLQTLFEEILLNAFDQTTREGTGCNTIKVNIDRETHTISIENNGSGISSEKQEVVVNGASSMMAIPEIVFGILRSGSNYDDTEERVTGGTNGYGAKLVNIWSTNFEVETVDSVLKKKTRFAWKDNMSECYMRKISAYASKPPFTKVSFTPDLARFGIDSLTDDIVSLMKKRLIDISFASKATVITWFNGKRISIKNPIDYMNLYASREMMVKPIADVSGERWTVGVMHSDCGFQQTSFVNGIHTKNGGTHVNTVVNKLVASLTEKIKKAKKLDLKPSDIKGKLHVFIRAFIVNPSFSSQTKEALKTDRRSFGSEYEMSDKFTKQLLSKDMIDMFTEIGESKVLQSLNKTSGSKTARLIGIKGLEDANHAGTAKSDACKLILTEGLSAKTFAMSAITVIGRDRFGIFPLKGKLMNARAASKTSIAANVEISNIVKILGLKHGEKYTSTKSLRYGGVVLLVDADQDGNHICGLILNLFHYFWPELIAMGYLNLCSTPIVKVNKKAETISFLNLNDFNRWEQQTPNAHTYSVKYYKGLGTSTAKEAKECLENIDSKLLMMTPDDDMDGSVELAFNDKKANDRKEWLKFRYDPSDNIDRSVREVAVSDFINKELVHFSYYSNQRSLPSVVDGLKPSQRKILFTAIKYLSVSEMKVAQFGAKVAEKTDYHHGEASLMEAIVNMGQNYVGSNNINLVDPIGCFGTRLWNGDDAASPRYIFTKLAQVAKTIFHKDDAELLEYLESDNMKIEPEYYVPVIPMVLVNGANGIGTGCSTKVLKYNPVDICAYLKCKMRGTDTPALRPWYRGFNGSILESGKNSYTSYGKFEYLDDLQAIRITELPIGTSTESYKDLLEKMLTEKMFGIQDVILNHSDIIVDFTLIMDAAAYKKTKATDRDTMMGLLKLTSSLSYNNMHLFNKEGIITKYDTVEEIIDEFYAIRLIFYKKRKEAMINQLEHELKVLSNKARFIRYVKSAKQCSVDILNMKAKQLSDHLLAKKFDMIPENDPEFKYLINMQIRSITNENADKLDQERDDISKHLEKVKKTSIESMWETDLDAIVAANKLTNDELAEDLLSAKPAKSATKAKKTTKKIIKK